MRPRVCRRWLMGGLGMLACLLMAGSLSAAPVYPLTTGPTGRYLVDQQGVPFLIAGESPQAMIGNLSAAEAELFFQNRQAHGFNTVWINLLCAKYTACRDDGKTFDGIPPFTTLLNNAASDPSAPNFDLSQPNEAYFARVDQMLRLAAKYNFLVILDPAETGSWLEVMRTNGVNKCRAYGQFLGKRYTSFDNILWMHGNDYRLTELPTADDDAYTTAVALGIRDFDTRHLHTVEFNYRVSSSFDDERWLPLIEVNASYTYYATYEQVLKDYNRPNFLPTFMVEASYEFENNAGTPGVPQVLRSQEYWSNLSGATGQLYGNKYTWQFIDGWKEQLDTPGAVQMAYVTALFEPRAWYALVPDQDHSIVTAGSGTFGTRDYVTAARTPDGTLMMAYVPSARTLTVNLSTLSGPVTARWYDPAGGVFLNNIPGSPLANTGSHNFTTPGQNADGDEDWVLVLEVFSTAAANLRATLESPEHGQSVSGITTIRGWGFDTQEEEKIDSVELFIDGAPVSNVPCCSSRGDVQAAFPQFPSLNTENSGWGAVMNWGVLSAGSHTVQVQIKSTTGETLSTEPHMVTVVKPGDFEFLDQFDLSQATAKIVGDELVVEGVVVRDHITQQQREIDVGFRWFSSSQSLGMVEALTKEEVSSLWSVFASWLSPFVTALAGVATPTATYATTDLVATFESPEDARAVSGISLSRGWAFPEQADDAITEVRLLVDGSLGPSIPCCSTRGDVAKAFPAVANALNSGWGITFNYGVLSSGPHQFGVQIRSAAGDFLVLSHGVTVARLGGSEFLDQFDLSHATARIQDGTTIVMHGVEIRDKASGQSKVVDVFVQWMQSNQALGIVAANIISG